MKHECTIARAFLAMQGAPDPKVAAVGRQSDMSNRATDAQTTQTTCKYGNLSTNILPLEVCRGPEFASILLTILAAGRSDVSSRPCVVAPTFWLVRFARLHVVIPLQRNDLTSTSNLQHAAAHCSPHALPTQSSPVPLRPDRPAAELLALPTTGEWVEADAQIFNLA